MKLITLGVAAALAVGSVGVACATPVFLNGNFAQANNKHSIANPAEISGSFHGASGSCNAWGGNFVGDWTAKGYSLWYPSAGAASTTDEATQYGCASTQLLPAGVAAPPNGGPAFVGLDGQDGVQGEIWQKITDLTVGTKYVLAFDWATTQEMSRHGATWDYLQVDLGKHQQSGGDGTTSTSQKTATNQIPSHGFSGWASVSMTFTANATSDILSFLSIGGQIECNGQVFDGSLSSCSGTLSQVSFAHSAGLPPFALLANVSISKAVPEPPELALFGLGLLGLGLATVVARRRALRRDDVDGDRHIVG